MNKHMTPTIQIDKRIPLLKRGASSGRPPKYPFGEMKVGHSFEVSKADSNRVRQSAFAYGKTHNMKFATRMQATGLLRVWRIK